MAKPAPTTITAWLQGLSIPWLAGNTNGRADVTSYGTLMDDQVTRLRAAVKARMPDYAPSDALPFIGSDRVLLQGDAESDDSFRTRLKYAWEAWARAGTWVGLLEQFWFNGYTSAVIVQQNGLAYYIDGTLTPGGDPIDSLVIVELPGLPTDLPSPDGPTIPAGTPWWYFDDDTAFCSRFAVIFPDGEPDNAPKIAQLIRTWRPARATCVGVFAIVSGLMWGWPPEQAWGDPGLAWGGNVVSLSGPFA